MIWAGLFFILGGAGMFLSNKKGTGMSIGAHEIQQETGKQYGTGCISILIGLALVYFAST